MAKKPVVATKKCEKHEINYAASMDACPYCKREEEKKEAGEDTTKPSARTTSRVRAQRGSRLA